MVIDIISQLVRDVQQLKQEGADVLQTEIISILQMGDNMTGSDPISGNSGVRNIGSSFVLGHPSYGDIGSGTAQAGSPTFLGDSRGATVNGTWATTGSGT